MMQQDRTSFNTYNMDQTDGGSYSPVIQKPAMRRALGELTNSPRLLSPVQPSSTTTPTKQMGQSPASRHSPAITPTHNLKLLTDLATKVANGATGSSARQTLQFEDVDPNRFSNQPVFLTNQNLSPSPHRDHTYINKSPILSAKFEPKDEVCDDYLNLQEASNGYVVSYAVGNSVEKKSGRSGTSRQTPASLPPMPDESQLFVPPVERGNRKDKSLGLLAEKMLQNYPFMLDPGDWTEVHLDDTAKLLNTERRRIYDIVNVFEAVQIMSKVGKNLYNWHGRTYLMHSLAWLRQLGLKLGMPEQLRLAREQEREYQDIENMSPLQSPRLGPNDPMASPLMSSPYSSPGMSPYGSPNDPNGTSMGINTQKFLMLFLVCPQQKTLTLEYAARVIHGACPNDKTKVTRVRRLYDIANILQALGLITKVQLTDGKSRKPAFKYVGPVVEHMELTDEEKRNMPSSRQKNSLLAVGRNLASLPDREEEAAGLSGGIRKRARSLSGDVARMGGGGGSNAQHSLREGVAAAASRTRSVERLDSVPLSGSSRSSSSLIQLGEVCEKEMAGMLEPVVAPPLQEKENRRESTTSEKENRRESTTTSEAASQMKPPTPVRPPSRKKVLLQRYYSDSALQHSFSSPKPPPPPPTHYSYTNSPGNPSASPLYSPRPPLYSPRSVPFPSPLALKSSPAQPTTSTTTNGGGVTLVQNPPPHSPRYSHYQHHQQQQRPTTLRSPVTPRDLRNAAILPPLSPVPGCSTSISSSRSKLLPCSPMGPVGRSLLSSPASPRSPIDLTTTSRQSVSHRHGRSPLASRSLNLPPSPQTSSADSNSPKPLTSLLKCNNSEMSSPLLRAYLANNKQRAFKPIPSASERGSGSDSIHSLSPPPTPLCTPPGLATFSPDHSTTSSSASELEGIFPSASTITLRRGGLKLPPVPSSSGSVTISLAPANSSTTGQIPVALLPPSTTKSDLIRLPSMETPIDFSGLLTSPLLPPPVKSRNSTTSTTSLVTPTFTNVQNI